MAKGNKKQAQKLNKKALKVAKQSAPQLDIKGDDFMHVIPDDLNIELIIHWKASKGQQFQPESINPVHAFAKQDGKLKVINRHLMDTSYTFDLKEVSKVFIMPVEL